MILGAITDLWQETHAPASHYHQMWEESDEIFPLHGDLYQTASRREQRSVLLPAPMTRPAGDLQQTHGDSTSMWT